MTSSHLLSQEAWGVKEGKGREASAPVNPDFDASSYP